jgi:2,5-furandicarboxylate decarboxylase 1
MTSDLRSFIRDAQAAGRLYRVRAEVDPHRNLAALCDESDRAIVFENVAGYRGWQVVANCMVNRDMEAVAFKQPRNAVVQAVLAGLDRGPRQHRLMETGPVKEVIWHGDDADLRRLPVAIHSELDGGPYIGSAIGVAVDPDTGIHNVFFPRTKVANGKTCPFFVYSPHTFAIMSKYAKRRQPMPMALVIGHHPAWEVMAASSIRHPAAGELDYVGSLLGEETGFVRCETIPVDVPASAEIIVECEIPPGVFDDEGPFGDYLGTYATGPMAKAGVIKAPVLQVKCITTRRDPIYRHLQATVWTDHQRLFSLTIEANLYAALLEMGLDIHDVYIPPYAGAGLTVIQMTPRGPGEVRDALFKAAMWENTSMSTISQLAIAVNRDVNIYDARDLLWALTIRTHWANDVAIVPGTRSSPFWPAGEQIRGSFYRLGSKAMVDATHLPPRSDAEWWDHNRAWPMGKDTISLADVIPDFRPAPLRQERLVRTDSGFTGAKSRESSAGD